MQTKTKLGLVLLVSVLPIAAIAAGAESEKVWRGTLIAVDTQDKTVTAKKWYITRTFNVGDNCTIAALNKKDASLSDLSPGEKVRIRYQESQGVLLADRI